MVDALQAVRRAVSFLEERNGLTAAASVIEGELGSLLIDRINATEVITFCPRRGESEILYHKHIENNMNFEVEAFRDMVSGIRSETPYLIITEQTMRTYDKARIT